MAYVVNNLPLWDGANLYLISGSMGPLILPARPEHSVAVLVPSPSPQPTFARLIHLRPEALVSGWRRVIGITLAPPVQVVRMAKSAGS